MHTVALCPQYLIRKKDDVSSHGDKVQIVQENENGETNSARAVVIGWGILSTQKTFSPFSKSNP